MTLLTEFDEEASIRGWRNDGIVEGRLQDASNMLKKKYPLEEILEITGLSMEKIQELQKSIPVEA